MNDPKPYSMIQDIDFVKNIRRREWSPGIHVLLLNGIMIIYISA